MSEAERLRYELLLLRCRRNDTGAFDELFELWDRRLYYYVRRLVESDQDAQDVAQDTWLAILRGVDQVRDAAKLPYWLHQVARHTAYRWRRRQRLPVEPLDDEPTPDDGEDLAFAVVEAAALQQALETLSVAHREVVVLHLVEEFDLAEIAALTSTPVGTVKSRLHYAKRALRERLDEGGRP